MRLSALLAALYLVAFTVTGAAYWQSRDQINVGAASYVGPGNVSGFTTGVLAFWALRGFNTAFSGAVASICDSATGATCADATWAGSTLTLPTIGGNACDNSTHQCEVAKLYDQSGASACSGACDVSDVHGTRPLLVVNCSGTLPCMDPNAQVGLSSANIASSTSQPYTLSSVARRDSGGQSTISSAGSNNSEGLFGSGANTVAMYAGSAVPTAVATDGVIHTLQFLFNNASSVIYVDSTSNAVSIGTANAIGSGAIFGFPKNTSGFLAGRVFEAGWWAGDKSATFSNMHSNQCAYYGTVC